MKAPEPGGEEPLVTQTLRPVLIVLALGELVAYPVIRRLLLARLRGASMAPSTTELCESFGQVTSVGGAAGP